MTKPANQLHRFTTLTLAACAALFSSISVNHARSAEKRSVPNIVFILADDLGYGDLRCYNPKSKIPTPNLDRLASQGMRFTDMHTPSAVCTPTRYGLLTGRYCWRTRLKRGVLIGDSPMLVEPDRMTLASFLKKRGYATLGVGKWHLGLGDAKKTDFSQPLKPGPNSVGFDYYFGLAASLDMPPYVFFENDRVTVAPTEKIGDSKRRRLGGPGFWRAGPIAPGFKHVDVLPKLTDKAVEVIGKQTKDKPFFLYFPLTAPHMPWMPTEEFRGKSGAGYYGDFVVEVDAMVGRVVKALDEARLTDNTLVIVTSDNGAEWYPDEIEKWQHRANDGLRGGKADIWDGGHRVPFLARWPGHVPENKTSKELLCLTDLLATTAAIVGDKLPDNAGEDSFDFSPVLLGKSVDRPIREAVVHHSGDGTFGIRQGPWKLAMALGSHGFSTPVAEKAKADGPQGQLYNLEDDPQEEKNLWLEKPEVVKRLTTLLEKYQREGRSRP